MNSRVNKTFLGSRVLPLMLAIAIAVGLSFAAGIYVGHSKVFPFGLFQKVHESILGGREASNVAIEASNYLDTSTVKFEIEHVDIAPGVRKWGGGGGISRFRDGLLGVTKEAEIFLYGPELGVHKPGIVINTNASALRNKAEDPNDGDPEVLTYFRALDLVAHEHNAGVDVFVSHHYWHAELDCKTIRITRLSFESADLLTGEFADDVQPTQDVIFESHPCLEFSMDEWSPFQSVNNGGRMLLLDDDNLLFSIGDHYLDGVNNPTVVSQDADSHYGKLIRLDLDSLDTRVVATGVRNPQGLARARDGTIWETEHGPQGGDELNVIIPGENYGWPLETYGTQYGTFDWPLNSDHARSPRYVVPVYSWVPSVAVSALIEVRGTPAAWDTDLLVSSLAAGSLYRIRLQDGRAVFVEPIRIGERVRDIDQLADGTIALWTDQYALRLLTVAPESAHTAKFPVQLTQSEVDLGLHEVLLDCGTCHSFVKEGVIKNGPPLWKIRGRTAGTADYSRYSNALKNSGLEWGDEELRRYLKNPQHFMQGTTMPNPAIKDEKTLDALVGYLSRLR